MLVKNGALVLSVSNPAPLLEAMPNAKLLNFKGRQIVAVKHTLDSAKVLRNLGLNAPSTLLYDGYRFPGRYAPMENQVRTAEFLTLNRRAFVLNAMRTGKTSASLWTVDYLKERKLIQRILVVCPLSVMDVWARESFSTIPHRSCVELIGKREKRIELLKTVTDIAVINFDGLVIIQEQIKKFKPDLIIVDEADAYCNPHTKRYKALRNIMEPDTRLWLLTGTPTPNAPTDAYGLIKLVCPEKIPASFKLFQETLMQQRGPYKWVPRPGAAERVLELMQPAIRYTKEQCFDLPPLTYNDRTCLMSEEQQKVFTAVKAKMRHEDEEGTEITAVNAAVKLIKLQQIMCGVVKDDNENAVFLNPHHRLKLLEELIKQAQAKVIVFAPFKFAMQMIVNHLAPKWSTELVNGDVSKHDRNDIFTRFKDSSDPHILVAHPKVAAHGQDLSAADMIIWYAPIFSNVQYEQANERMGGVNQKLATSIYHIYCHNLEAQIYRVLQNKGALQSKVLSLYSELMAQL